MQRTEEVQRLQEQGCSVLCLDCPEGMLFGIDYSAWSVGPRFMGVKLVPPGLHYVYSSASSEEVGLSRTGFFLWMRPRDVSVLRWDPETEELVRLESSDEEARYADGVRCFDFDSRLGPYPLQLSEEWTELTRYATLQVVSKIEPVAKMVRSKRAEYDDHLPHGAAQAEQPAAPAHGGHAGGDADVSMTDGQEGCGAPGAEVPQAEARKPPGSFQLESNSGGSRGGGLFFSAVPRGRKRTGNSPQETTRLHMDGSTQLEEMIAREYGGDELGILGELQLAYIAFLLGQNCDGFDQWRALLQLLCSCEAAVAGRPALFGELCRAFFAQLSQAPSDLFGVDLTRDNFMGACAIQLLEVCDTDGSPPKLRKRCEKLRELVQQKFGISTEDLALLGEDAPQVVDEGGRDLVQIGGPDLCDMD